MRWHFVSGAYELSLERDSEMASHAIEVLVRRPSGIEAISDEVSHNKGCAILEKISRYLRGIFW
ncbi:hypothetical protein B0O99DRAFT_621597 [Bisporella sp. PMI_857]|nr:hypothetical protein B0O99DRAFT_621597 [Bisporella sp. PMI_857]